MRLASPATCAGLALLAVVRVHGAGVMEPDRLAGLKARSIGPAGMSGRIAAVEGVASEPRTVYVGAATGGLWRSRNGGVTWEPLFDDQPVHAVGAIAVFQANPQVLWVGTGEGNPRNSASIGGGVYRSLDAGKTWQHLGLEKTERIHRIALHPGDPQVAYVCALGQEWGENPDRGVFKTEDGGRSWKKVLYVDERTGCGDMAMDPGNPQKLFAGMWQFRRWPWHFKSGGPGSGLHVTHDGGATWKKLQEEDGLPKGELGRTGLAISRSNPEVVYALTEAEKSVLLRSDDGGRTFKKVNEKVSVAPRPFYFCDLRVDPAWPLRVYSLDYEVRVSNDGGKTFETLRGAAWAQIHGDHHALWINPGDPHQMYDGNDGGVAESRDRGETFRFVGNLPLAQFYHVAVDGETPYHVYGGLQDNGSWRGPAAVWQDGGIRNYHWESVGGGDGFDTQPDPRDSNIVYSMWQGGNLGRYDRRTGEWRAIKPPPSPDRKRLRFNWNAGLAVDPFEPDTLYLGSQFLHRSKDRGETWEVISPDLTTNDPEKQKQDESGGLTPDVTSAETHTTIMAIAPSPIARGVIWVGSDDGRVHVTRDGGKSWTSVEKAVPGVPAGTWVPHVEASKFDAGAAYAVFDNHRRSDFTPYVFVTEDYGATWRSLATPELRGYALVVEQDPVKKELLFLGTEFGLYTSLDGGRRWHHLKKTLPTASVMDLVVHPREHDLVIATHGRALFVLDDIRPLRALSEATLQEPLRFFGVADAQQHWRKAEDGGFGFGAGEFRGQNRPYGAVLTFSLNLPGLPLHDQEKERARKEREREEKRKLAPAPKDKDKEKDDEPKVEVRVTDAAGRAVRTFKAPAKLGINRAVWDLHRDAFKQLPRPEDAPPQEEEPTGPEVAPGTYTLTLSYAGQEAKQTVNVLADPRARNTAAQWQAREQAVRRAGVVSDAAVDAVWRLRRTRDDVSAIQQKARERAEGAGEKDKKRIEDLPLVKAGEALKEELTQKERGFWQPPEAKGILPEKDVLSRIGYASFYVGSSWDAPSPTHLTYLQWAEEELQALLKDVNQLFDTKVAAYRQQAVEAGIGLLPAAEPLRLPAPGK
jgi:photosystem II stability/assembly factor-like uncharacterized protein